MGFRSIVPYRQVNMRTSRTYNCWLLPSAIVRSNYPQPFATEGPLIVSNREGQGGRIEVSNGNQAAGKRLDNSQFQSGTGPWPWRGFGSTGSDPTRERSFEQVGQRWTDFDTVASNPTTSRVRYGCGLAWGRAMASIRAATFRSRSSRLVSASSRPSTRSSRSARSRTSRAVSRFVSRWVAT